MKCNCYVYPKCVLYVGGVKCSWIWLPVSRIWLRLKEVNHYDIKIWQQKRLNVMRAGEHKCSESERKRHKGIRERERQRGRLTDKGWHVPMSINSPERLIVRNKALYTSHSDKQRSTGTTRPRMCVFMCVWMCLWVCLTKFYYVCSLFLSSQQTRDTFPKHLISICTFIIFNLTTVLTLPSLRS